MPPVEISALAEQFGPACAIRHSGGEISYAELARRVDERKIAFAGRGVGDRAALVCVSEPDTLISALALFELGCMIIPVSAEMPETELGALAGQCGISWIVNRVQASATGCANHHDNRGAILALLSSGSTGKPKLVLRSEVQVRAAMEIYAKSVGLSAADRVMAVVPLEHAYGFANVFLASLSRGAAIAFPGTNHPRAVAEAARREQITIFPGAPLFFDLMAKFARPSDGGLGAVRCCISVGTALATRINDAFVAAFNLPIWQSYGASEAGPVCLNKSGVPDGEVLALGAPCEGAEILIQNEDGSPAPGGEAGEIIIRSPAVGIGYEGPNDGASRIEPRVFYTGDLGCLRGGILYFRGRRKLLVAAAGNKVDPQEVENVLLRHPKIEDAAIVAHREADSREQVKALIVLREPATMLEITDYCSSQIAAFKVPRIIEFRDSLPRNAMGKLQREKL